LFPVGSVTMGRFEPDDSVTTVASWSCAEVAFPTGMRWPTKGTNVAWIVLQTGRPGRIDDFSAATDPIGVAAREAGYTSAVGSPIVVEGHLWGLISATSTEGPLPTGTEVNLASFTELVATAIANSSARSELIASRARIVSAGDEARRRIERNLHDGTQQRLIALGLDLQHVRGTMRANPEATASLERIERDLESILEELRELSRGLHPPLLSRAGLDLSLRELARRSPIPVHLEVELSERPPTAVETAIYYVVSEALTNAIKHAHASAITVTITSDRSTLSATVADDGVGGAEPGDGSGLVGLADRVNALGGRFVFDSPAGHGTRISVELPLEPPITV
jgi:signal transduction histidine kinase